MKKYQDIPTNIITGFLGVGKTTLIRSLLKNKSETERWAVLVNEFGEVGIDGALMNADGIAVKEVAGGCMCCAVGLPSRTALNRLIKQQNPHRIIIEPTGLAHPRQVLDMFGGQEYQGVLDMRAVICLVDPWCITQASFTALPAFQDQVSMADVLVATKSDLASDEQLMAFQQFTAGLQPKKKKVLTIADGNFPLSLLDLKHADSPSLISHDQASGHHNHEQHAEAEASGNALVDSDGVVRTESATEFAVSCGWVFPKDQLFDLNKLYDCIQVIAVARVKGVFHTEQGCYVINKMRDVISREPIESDVESDIESDIESEGKSTADSRVEMIDTEKKDWQAVDRVLKACRC